MLNVELKIYISIFRTPALGRNSSYVHLGNSFSALALKAAAVETYVGLESPPACTSRCPSDAQTASSNHSHLLSTVGPIAFEN